jgi:hypothetical protein
MKAICKDKDARVATCDRLRNVRTYISSLSAIALTAGAVTVAKPADASLLDVFIIAEHTAPTADKGPLSFTTETVYKLNVRSDGRSTSGRIVDNFDVTVDSGLTFNNDDYNNGVNFDADDQTDQISPIGTLNPELEAGQGTEDYYNSQVATWDTVNKRDAAYTYDPAEQIDFGRNAPVIFNPVKGGFTELVVAELGGLNTFDLWVCEDAACNVGAAVFEGLSNSFSTALFLTEDFALEDDADTSQVDQTWLFRFSAPVTGYVRLLEEDSRKVYDRTVNDRLQVDFIGAGGIPVPAVPVPTSLPLLAGGLCLLGFVIRRRRKA